MKCKSTSLILLFIFLYLCQAKADQFYINNLKQHTSFEDLKESCYSIKYVDWNENESSWIVTLPWGTVVNEGAILTQEGYQLSNVLSRPKADPNRLSKEGRDINEENPQYFDGNLAVISSTGSENWFHWLLQVLPRLIILKHSGIHYDKIYINNLNYSWQKESLKIVLDKLSIDSEKLLVINNDCIIKATNLIVPEVTNLIRRGQSSLWTTQALRDHFLENQPQIRNKRILVSRAKASSRRIINEMELMHILKPHRFELVHLEELTPKAQATLFNQAEIIIAPHGSALANLIFTEPNYQIIEIIPEHFGDSFLRPTRLTQGHYKSIEIAPSNEWNDMVVDPFKLLALIDLNKKD